MLQVKKILFSNRVKATIDPPSLQRNNRKIFSFFVCRLFPSKPFEKPRHEKCELHQGSPRGTGSMKRQKRPRTGDEKRQRGEKRIAADD